MSRYPTEPELKYIEKFDITRRSVKELIDYVKSIWGFENWGFKLKGKKVLYLELHTGGWSGNEEILQSLKKNYLFWGMYWEKSIKGGHHYFKIKELKK